MSRRVPTSMLAGLAGLLAVALGGCTGGSQADAGGSDMGQDRAGALSGLVVDDAVRPVADALVRLSGGGIELNTTTNVGGTFRFEGLEAGSYVVEASKAGYSTVQQAATVQGPGSGVEPELVRFQLVFQPQTIPYADLYKWDGFFECGVWPTNGCANVNIVTGIMLCSLDLPCFNATGDRSVELHPIGGVPDFLQSEMVWEPTSSTGEGMDFGLGSATRQELQDGFADGHNYTTGRSPLLLTLDGPTMAEAEIGGQRMLLIQASVGVTFGSPACPPELGPPCGLGVSANQPYTTYTHAFYGYQPPMTWRFTVDGPPPGPA